MGAVDAVGSNLVQRLGGLGGRNTSATSAGAAVTSGVGGAAGTQQRGITVRDV